MSNLPVSLRSKPVDEASDAVLLIALSKGQSHTVGLLTSDLASTWPQQLCVVHPANGAESRDGCPHP